MTTQTAPDQTQETPEQKQARLAAKRDENHRKLQARTADGLDKAVRTIKVTSAKLDESADAASISTIEEALDTLRSVRDSLRESAKGESASEESTDQPSNESTDQPSGESTDQPSGESAEGVKEEAPKREPATAGSRR